MIYYVTYITIDIIKKCMTVQEVCVCVNNKQKEDLLLNIYIYNDVGMSMRLSVFRTDTGKGKDTNDDNTQKGNSSRQNEFLWNRRFLFFCFII